MHRFDLAAIAPMPWKNGAGATRELACWPPGAGMDDFEWRVSVADVGRPGPFSAFPRVERQIMLLAGDGMHLRGPGLDHRLDQPWQPFAFDGAVPVHCDLLGGACSDFNLMLRGGAWHGGIEVVRGERLEPPWPSAGLCLVLAGAWRLEGGGTLVAGQGGWWCDGAAPPGHWTPMARDGVVPVLVRVALERCEIRTESASSARPPSASSYQKGSNEHHCDCH